MPLCNRPLGNRPFCNKPGCLEAAWRSTPCAPPPVRTTVLPYRTVLRTVCTAKSGNTAVLCNPAWSNTQCERIRADAASAPSTPWSGAEASSRGAGAHALVCAMPAGRLAALLCACSLAARLCARCGRTTARLPSGPCQ
eukprot:366551-Chlamydomonas_euryale.AAC.24